MGTKVKVAIAAVIVSALIAMIVFDQRTRTTDTPPPASTGDAGARIDVRPVTEEPVQVLGVDFDTPGPVETQRVEIIPERPVTPADTATPEPVPPAVPAPPATETYEVRSGDVLCKIAEKKYGDSNLWTLIAKANPEINPNRLRLGQKLVIPAKPVAGPAAAPAPVDETDGTRSYVVQAGEFLGEIAQRVYGTASRAVIEQIAAANPGLSPDGYNLRAGMKLVLPSVERPSTEPRIDATQSQSLPNGVRTHTVQNGDSLWKVAKQYRGSRTTSAMIEIIRKANAEKLPGSSHDLRVGWVLVIPE